MRDFTCVLFITVGLRWIIFKSFHSQASHLPIVYWRHYSYKWTFVLKECRVCRRVGGWEGGSNSAVCRGLLFILIKTINPMSSEDEIYPRIKTRGCRKYPDPFRLHFRFITLTLRCCAITRPALLRFAWVVVTLWNLSHTECHDLRAKDTFQHKTNCLSSVLQDDSIIISCLCFATRRKWLENV